MMSPKGIRTCVVFIFIALAALPAGAQHKVLKGIVKDGHSDEMIPFASLQFKKSTFGKLTDSAGNFSFNLARWPSDTLVVSYVGFDDKFVFIDTTQSVINLVISMDRGKSPGEVIVKGKINRGLMLWRKIVKNKPQNNRTKFIMLQGMN